MRNMHKILLRICRILSAHNSRHQIRFANDIAAAIAATSGSKIRKLHKIPVQNVKKLQNLSHLINLYVSPKPVPTPTPTTIPPLRANPFSPSQPPQSPQTLSVFFWQLITGNW